MTDAVLHRETAEIYADRGAFGIQEERHPPQRGGPTWLELDWDSIPVRTAPGAVRLVSRAGGTHCPTVTIEVRSGQSANPGPEFELIGSGAYQSCTGVARVWSFDSGPYLPFSLKPDTLYDIRVWRKGGESARARYDTLMGKISPITGLEEYLIIFSDYA